MALPNTPDARSTEKLRPKSCEIVTQKSEWKRSFENRKSVFEQSSSHPLDKKFASSLILDTQSHLTSLENKKV